MYTHGMSKTKIYDVWCKMKERCLNPKSKDYPYYGGRGVSLEEKWRNFEGFYDDMGDPPPNYTLERVDNSKGYCKSNCKWASRYEQNLNKRNSRLISYSGITKTLSEWAKDLGVTSFVVWDRINRGMPLDRALTTKFIDGKHRNYKKRVFYKGEGHTLSEFVKKTSLSYAHVGSLLCSGKTPEEVMERSEIKEKRTKGK